MEMETCTTFGLLYQRFDKSNHGVTKNHPASTNKYFCQQCKSILNTAGKIFHLQSNEYLKKMLL